ncbi:hypothetical protein [Solicola gregarius]|uniref:Uncharacterized protein n=1 Tax=Solicola gregarius TaxID=2908642 RepID=A0AA46TJX2_9ACTN|nr:hypothetical protein [Solicola gregarius]UYM06714.1 hypothetical protein L0C25_06485 [Solicola gregarius]
MVLRAVAAAAPNHGSRSTALPSPPAVWHTSECWLAYDEAAKAGFVSAISQPTSEYALWVTDVGRSILVDGAEGREKWGIGYRTCIEVNRASERSSRAAIAAAVQLGQQDAHARLEVIGYTGSRAWDVRYTPRRFDLAAHEDLERAIGDAHRILAEASAAELLPVLLAREEPSYEDSTYVPMSIGVPSDAAELAADHVDESILLVGLIHGVAQGQRIVDAANHLRNRSDQPTDRIQRLATAVYELMGHNDGVPSAEAVRRARGALQPLQ